MDFNVVIRLITSLIVVSVIVSAVHTSEDQCSTCPTTCSCEFSKLCCFDPCQSACGGSSGICCNGESIFSSTIVISTTSGTTTPQVVTSTVKTTIVTGTSTVTISTIFPTSAGSTTEATIGTSASTDLPIVPVGENGRSALEIAMEVVACLFGGGGVVTVVLKRKKIRLYLSRTSCAVRLSDFLSFGVRRVPMADGTVSYGGMAAAHLGRDFVWTFGDLGSIQSDGSSIQSGVVITEPEDNVELTEFHNPMFRIEERAEPDGSSAVLQV